MPILQFMPVKEPWLKHVIGDKYGTHISVPIQQCHVQNGVALETGERLEAMQGALNLCKEFGENTQELKKDGYLGVLSYQENIEAASFVVQVHVSANEFLHLCEMFSRNKLGLLNIETPLSDKRLHYGLLPTDPMVWKVRDQSWAPIEKCDISFFFAGCIAH